MNIFDDVDKIHTPKPDINHLDIDELFQLLNACREYYPEKFPLLFLLVGSGMRIGEEY